MEAVCEHCYSCPTQLGMPILPVGFDIRRDANFIYEFDICRISDPSGSDSVTNLYPWAFSVPDP